MLRTLSLEYHTIGIMRLILTSCRHGSTYLRLMALRRIASSAYKAGILQY